MNRIRSIAMTMSACLVAASFAGPELAWAREQPFNRVVLGIDASRSYQHRQGEALDKAKSLLDALAKQRVKRWEKADEVVIIAIDALPEVIWSGDARALAAMPPEQWQQRFAGRRDLSACTDVARFFRVAAQQLNDGPQPQGRYLFIFSDLVSEPPRADGKQCQAVIPADEVAKGMPWQAIKSTVTEVYWMPVAQKLAWSRATETNGHGMHLRFHSESESASALAEPPVQAQHPRNEQVGGNFWSGVKTLALWAAGLMGVAVFLPILLTLWRRRARPAQPNKPLS